MINLIVVLMYLRSTSLPTQEIERKGILEDIEIFLLINEIVEGQCRQFFFWQHDCKSVCRKSDGQRGLQDSAAVLDFMTITPDLYGVYVVHSCHNYALASLR